MQQQQNSFKIIDAVRWYIKKSKSLWESGGSKRPSSKHLEKRRDEILDAMVEFDEFIQWVKAQERPIYQAPLIPQGYERVAVIG